MTLPRGWAETTIGNFIGGTHTLDPRGCPDEPFDLFSVPSYSDYAPEKSTGREIGSSKQIVQEGDVLLCKIVPHIRRGWVVPAADGRRQIASGEWIVFRDHGLEAEYIRRFVLSDLFHDQFMRTVSGVGGSLMRARPSEAAQIPFPLPPLAEQRRIVAKLDTLTVRLRRARTELDRVAAMAKEMRWAVIATVFASLKDTAKFADVLDYKGGSQPPKSTFSAGPEPGRIRLLQIRDFASNAKAVYIDDNGKWPRCTAHDVMIGRYGASVGKILTGKAGAYNVALVKMTFDGATIHRKFLFHWLKSDVFQAKLTSISRSAQDGFNKEDLADLPFPLLPFAEQAKIATGVEIASARADRLEAEAARAAKLLDRLEAAILARAFRGELVPQDPADEPASALLDRIRAERAAAPTAKRRRRLKQDA